MDIRSMIIRQPITPILLLLAWLHLGATHAQDAAPPIPDSKIAMLEAKLGDQAKTASASRKKLSIRRVIREGEALLKANSTAPNRYEVLGVLFQAQRELMSLDNAASNRRALLETSRLLADAPDEYAAVRLDADLLLSQSEMARKGGDLHARAEALRPLVDRYRDTKVEAKVIRIAMIMALEFGDVRLIDFLRQTIAERTPGDLEMINFQRDKLGGQVFGAPFVARFERADGTSMQFPMDGLGTTTALYFWSKENDGEEDLKALAAAWQVAHTNAIGRFQFVSVNMDNLPDAGERILREQGLDWPALRMSGGPENPVYHAYVRRPAPTILNISPTGYAALYQAGWRSDRTYERRLQSMMARSWAKPRYSSQMQSILSGEFLVMPTEGAFDPAAPPEWKAGASGDKAGLPRTDGSVPEATLRAIQACFIDPPSRYRTPPDEVAAHYEKADVLCREAIAAHPKAPDLWVVRNRRIIALMGLWKMRMDHKAFAAAVSEANAVIENGCPPGVDVVARFCLARQALRGADADPRAIIKALADREGNPAYLATAALLALDMGERPLHEQYRRAFLDQHVDAPSMWTATTYLLDRYHRYWLYHPPYVAGWTYGRRQGHFLAIGDPEDAQRTFETELKTLEGDAVQIPASSEGKWTVMYLLPDANTSAIARYTSFLEDRPFEDVKVIAAVLNDDVAAAQTVIAARKKPDTFPTLLVYGGLQHPMVRQLGILAEDERVNILILRPDGSIANMVSGLTMSAQKANVIQHTLEWHDEQAVDEALARGDLEEARRLAFAFAPVEDAAAEGEKKKPTKKKIAVPHLRSRAKVYQAMGELEAASADAEETYLAVNSKAGYLSMRTEELEETEALRDAILQALEEQKAGK